MNRSLRIALFTLVGIGACVAWFYAQRPEALPPQEPDTWLEPIAAGMDASDIRVRHALMSAFSMSDYFDKALAPANRLPWRCGETAMTSSREEYDLYVGDWALAPNAQSWRVRIVPGRTGLDVSILDASMPVTPETKRNYEMVVYPQHHTREKKEVRPLQTALSNPALWRTQDNATGCSDGRPVLLTACVDGRYHASAHGCSHEPAVDRLWAELKREFPAPPPPQWIDPATRR